MRLCYGNEVAIYPGDRFVAAAAQPPLYHHVLQIPKTARELETLLKVGVDVNIKEERVQRAGFNGSGISRSNRMIERHESGHGSYWKSYDFASSAGKKNLFEYPLGPGKGEKTFEHDGGEIILVYRTGCRATCWLMGRVTAWTKARLPS